MKLTFWSAESESKRTTKEREEKREKIKRAGERMRWKEEWAEYYIHKKPTVLFWLSSMENGGAGSKRQRKENEKRRRGGPRTRSHLRTEPCNEGSEQKKYKRSINTDGRGTRKKALSLSRGSNLAPRAVLCAFLTLFYLPLWTRETDYDTLRDCDLWSANQACIRDKTTFFC